MDPEDILPSLRAIEAVAENVLNMQPGFHVQQCQWVIGKHPSESNVLSIVCRIDPDLAFAPPPPERDTINTPEQDAFDVAFKDLISGDKVDAFDNTLEESREQALEDLKELEEGF